METIEGLTNSIKNQINKLKPVSLDKECEKATKILRSFTFSELNNSKNPEKNIPNDIIKNAKGLAILTMGKAGLAFSIKSGSGIVISRLEDGSWSAPSAIKTNGVGIGQQIGAEMIDLVLVMNTKEAVRAFNEKDNITLEGSMSVSVGPMGRSAEAGSSIKVISPIYSYSRSKGAFIGISFEGSIIEQCRDSNIAVYGENVTQTQILSGAVQRPKFAENLYQALYECEFPQAVKSNQPNQPSNLPPPAYESNSPDDNEDAASSSAPPNYSIIDDQSNPPDYSPSLPPRKSSTDKKNL